MILQPHPVRGGWRYNERLLRWGFLWLLTVVVLPFPTELIADHNDDRWTIGMYIGEVALSSVCLTAMTSVIQANPHLLRVGARLNPDAVFRQRAITAGFLLALGVGLVFPVINFSAMLLVVLVNPAWRLWRRKHGESWVPGHYQSPPGA